MLCYFEVNFSDREVDLARSLEDAAEGLFILPGVFKENGPHAYSLAAGDIFQFVVGKDRLFRLYLETLEQAVIDGRIGLETNWPSSSLKIS